MAKFTLFEVHLDDATLTANAPFSNQSGPDVAEDGSEVTGDEGSPGEDETTDGRGIAPLVVVLVVLVVLAVVVKKLVGASETDEESLPE